MKIPYMNKLYMETSVKSQELPRTTSNQYSLHAKS